MAKRQQILDAVNNLRQFYSLVNTFSPKAVNALYDLSVALDKIQANIPVNNIVAASDAIRKMGIFSTASEAQLKSFANAFELIVKGYNKIQGLSVIPKTRAGNIQKLNLVEPNYANVIIPQQQTQLAAEEIRKNIVPYISKTTQQSLRQVNALSSAMLDISQLRQIEGIQTLIERVRKLGVDGNITAAHLRDLAKALNTIVSNYNKLPGGGPETAQRLGLTGNDFINSIRARRVMTPDLARVLSPEAFLPVGSQNRNAGPLRGIMMGTTSIVDEIKNRVTEIGVGSIQNNLLDAIAGSSSINKVNNLNTALTGLLSTYSKISKEVINAAGSQANLAKQFDRIGQAARNYVFSSQQKQTPFDQLLLKMRTQSGASFPSWEELFKSTSGGFGGEAGLKKLESYISRYGFAMSDLKRINREASTGITRFNLDKVFTVGKESFVENLTVSLDSFGNVLHDTQNRFRSFSSSLIRDIGEVTKWTIAVGLVYTPIKKLQELMSEMISNQSKLAEIQVITGQTTEELYNTFLRLSQVANKTSEDIAGTAESFKLAYIAAGNIKNEYERTATATALLADAQTLAKLTGLGDAQAMDIMSAGLKQLGMGLDEGYKLLDKWVAVSKVANVSVATLAQGFAIVSSAADDVGLKIDELNGVIAAVSEVTNLSAVETGNMVRAFVSGFQTDTASKELAKYGIAVRDTEGKVRNFMDVMRQIRSFADQGIISDQQLAKINETLGGGARRGAQMSAFQSNLERIQDISEISSKAQGDAAQAMSIRTKTVESAAMRLQNAFSILAQTLGVKGGILEGITSLTDNLTKLVESINSIVTGLGRLAPMLLTTGAAFLYLGSNSGAKSKLLNMFQELVYGAGYTLGTAGIKTREGGVEVGPQKGSRLSQRLATWISGRPTTIEDASGVRQTIPMGDPLWLGDRQKEGRFITKRGGVTQETVIIKGTEAAGERMGQRFVQSIGQDPFKIIAGVEVFSTVLGKIGKGEWTSAAGSLIGASIGASLMKQNKGIGALVGLAIAEAFISGASKAPDYKTGYYQVEATFARDLETKQQEKLLSPQERVEKQLEKNLEQAVLGLGQAQAEEQGTLFTNLALNLMTGISKAAGNKQSEEEIAFAYRMKWAKEGELDTFYKAKEALTAFKSTGQIPTGMETKTSKGVKENIDKFKDLMDKATKKYIEDTAKELSYGQINASQYRERMQNIPSLPSKVGSIALAAGKDLIKISPNVKDMTEAYQTLADVILQLTPDEIEQIVMLSNELTTMLELGTQETDIFINKQLELNKVLNSMALAQKVKDIKIPQKTTTVLTEDEASKVYDLALNARDRFLEGISDPRIKEYMISQLEEIAVPIGELGTEAGIKYYKNFKAVGDEYWSVALKQAKGQGMLESQFQILEMTDVTKGDFLSKIVPRAKEIEDILTKAEFPVEKENIGVILKNFDTQKLFASLLAIRLAQQEANELLQKQLDGMFNLPEGATFYVPYNAALMSTKRGGGAGTGTSTTSATVEEITKFKGDLEKVFKSLVENIKNSISNLMLPKEPLPAETEKKQETRQTNMLPDTLSKLQRETNMLPDTLLGLAESNILRRLTEVYQGNMLPDTLMRLAERNRNTMLPDTLEGSISRGEAIIQPKLDVTLPAIKVETTNNITVRIGEQSILSIINKALSKGLAVVDPTVTSAIGSKFNYAK